MSSKCPANTLCAAASSMSIPPRPSARYASNSSATKWNPSAASIPPPSVPPIPWTRRSCYRSPKLRSAISSWAQFIRGSRADVSRVRKKSWKPQSAQAASPFFPDGSSTLRSRGLTAQFSISFPTPPCCSTNPTCFAPNSTASGPASKRPTSAAAWAISCALSIYISLPIPGGKKSRLSPGPTSNISASRAVKMSRTHPSLSSPSPLPASMARFRPCSKKCRS